MRWHRFVRYLAVGWLGIASSRCALNDRREPKGPRESLPAASTGEKTSGADGTSAGVVSEEEKHGRELYAQYCQSCHNPLVTSNKRGASRSDIRRGIANVPDMAELDDLRNADLRDIATALR